MAATSGSPLNATDFFFIFTKEKICIERFFAYLCSPKNTVGSYNG